MKSYEVHETDLLTVRIGRKERGFIEVAKISDIEPVLDVKTDALSQANAELEAIRRTLGVTGGTTAIQAAARAAVALDNDDVRVEDVVAEPVPDEELMFLSVRTDPPVGGWWKVCEVFSPSTEQLVAARESSTNVAHIFTAGAWREYLRTRGRG